MKGYDYGKSYFSKTSSAISGLGTYYTGLLFQNRCMRIVQSLGYHKVAEEFALIIKNWKLQWNYSEIQKCPSQSSVGKGMTTEFSQ